MKKKQPKKSLVKTKRSSDVANTLYERIALVIRGARASIVRSIDTTMVKAYWHIGQHIVEEEQGGAKRAAYGKELLRDVSSKLRKEFGRGFGVTTLEDIRKFYLAYMAEGDEKSHAVRGELETPKFHPNLSWTHFDRLAKSKDKAGLMKLVHQGQEISKPEDAIKDPFVLEFLDIPEAHQLVETKMEEALISKLQHFLLELGRGFAFVARQKRLTLDGKHYYADLVFYHTVLKCNIIIDLKTRELTHADLGQMLLYVNYYDRECLTEGDNPTLGLVLYGFNAS